MLVSSSLVKEMFSYNSVHGTERVIQEVDVCLAVQSPCQVNPGLLPPAEGHAPLPHQSQVPVHQLGNVLEEGTAALASELLLLVIQNR